MDVSNLNKPCCRRGTSSTRSVSARPGSAWIRFSICEFNPLAALANRFPTAPTWPRAEFSVCAALSKSSIACKAPFEVEMFELAIPKDSVVTLSTTLRFIWLEAPDPEPA